MSVDKFRRPPAHPLNESLHLGVLPDGLGGGVGRGQFFGGKEGMEFAVADEEQRLRFSAAPGIGLPVVSVNAGAVQHLPAADRAGT